MLVPQPIRRTHQSVGWKYFQTLIAIYQRNPYELRGGGPPLTLYKRKYELQVKKASVRVRHTQAKILPHPLACETGKSYSDYRFLHLLDRIVAMLTSYYVGRTKQDNACKGFSTVCGIQRTRNEWQLVTKAVILPLLFSTD